MAQRNTVEVVIKGEDQTSPLDNVNKRLDTLTKIVSFGAVKAGIESVVGAVSTLVESSGQLEGVEAAFKGVVESTGNAASDVLAELKKASKGTITNKNLMIGYNKAAQLVSTTFANQLPDAMQYLTKVAAATGQDMGFMMDSLVVGVGRMSPMILDNLGIQVNLTEAQQKYADEIGKTVEELTKQESQTALMNSVLESLKTNTASMPDVTENAATKWAAFNARLTDFRDRIGVKILPIISRIITILGKLFDAIFPVIEKAVEPLANGFATLIGVFGNMGNILANGGIEAAISSIINAFMQMFGLVGNEQMSPIAEQIGSVLGGALRQVSDVINNVVIPVFNYLIGTVLSAVVTFIRDQALPAAQRFFEWLGNVWTVVGPALASVFDWFVTTALPQVVSFVRDTVLPAVQNFFEWVGDTWEVVGPALGKFLDWFITDALPQIVDFVNNTVLPAVQDLFNFISEIWTLVSPALGDLLNWFITDGLPGIVSFINETVLPAIQGIINLISGIWTAVQPALDSFKTGIESVFNWIGNNVIQPVLNVIQGVINKINELRGVGTAQGMIASGLPPNLQIGAQGFATGTRYISADGLYQLHRGERVMRADQNEKASTININFTGTGAPQTRQEAERAGFMIVGSMRARGMAT